MNDAALATFTVTGLEQRDDGWHGIVHVNGDAIAVDRVIGCWRITPARGAEGHKPRGFRPLLPDYAAELQRIVRSKERKASQSTNQEDQTMTTTTTTDTPGKAGTAARAAGKGPAKPGKKPTTKTAAKGKAKSTKPAAPSTGKRKDEPIKGELSGETLDNYKAAKAAIPTTQDKAMNANRIAAKLSEKAGKTVWPIPTKKYLETAVDRGDAKKTADGKYYRK